MAPSVSIFPPFDLAQSASALSKKYFKALSLELERLKILVLDAFKLVQEGALASTSEAIGSSGIQRNIFIWL